MGTKTYDSIITLENWYKRNRTEKKSGAEGSPWWRWGNVIKEMATKRQLLLDVPGGWYQLNMHAWKLHTCSIPDVVRKACREQSIHSQENHIKVLWLQFPINSISLSKRVGRIILCARVHMSTECRNRTMCCSYVYNCMHGACCKHLMRMQKNSNNIWETSM